MFPKPAKKVCLKCREEFDTMIPNRRVCNSCILRSYGIILVKNTGFNELRLWTIEDEERLIGN